MSVVRQALASGLVLGALWGAIEALAVLFLPWQARCVDMRRVVPFDLVQAGAAALLAACRYVPPVLLATLLLAPVMTLLERRRPADQPSLAGPRSALALVVFAHLYWWTKPLWAFSWGLPFHHPKRLLLSAAWAALAAGVALLLVRPGRFGAPGPRTVKLTLLVLVLGGAWAGLRERQLVGGEPAAWQGERPPNVLLVVVDALRADRLGTYGYERTPPVSPRVDALAAEGVVFENTIVQAPFTWTSFGSMLTGKYPRRHGLIKMSPDQRLDPKSNRTLARALDEAGYATGAFLTGTLSNNSGLLDGFDTYFETIVGHEPVNRHSKWSVVRSRLLLSVLWNKLRQALDERLVNTEALSWISAHAGEPFFALVHYYSTHTPYDPPAPWDQLYDPGYEGRWHPFLQSHGVWIMKQQQNGVCELDGQTVWQCGHFDPVADVKHVNALYDGGVAFADDMFGDLLDLLEAKGIADNTLVIFTSDHGEELFDHGIFEHDWMFNTNLQIPLVMRFPQRRFAGARVSWPVEEIDIPSTVLEVTGVGTLDEPDGGPRSGPDGRSLLPDAAGTAPPEAELWAASENVRYLALQDGKRKIISNRFVPGSLRVFDLVADPGEHHPLDLTDPAHRIVLRELLTQLEAYDASQPAVSELKAGTISVETARQLASLGYTAGMSDELLDALSSGASLDAEVLLGDTQLMGSNEILEESLYERSFRWPPQDGSGR